MSEAPEAGKWQTLEIDYEMHRQLMYNTETHAYVNFEEQRGEWIDEREARRLFPRAFHTKESHD